LSNRRHGPGGGLGLVNREMWFCCHSGGNRSPESPARGRGHAFVEFLTELIKDSGLRIRSGVAIGRLRDETSPRRHVPAAMLAVLPNYHPPARGRGQAWRLDSRGTLTRHARVLLSGRTHCHAATAPSLRRCRLTATPATAGVQSPPLGGGGRLLVDSAPGQLKTLDSVSVRNIVATLPYSSTARNDGPSHRRGRGRYALLLRRLAELPSLASGFPRPSGNDGLGSVAGDGG